MTQQERRQSWRRAKGGTWRITSGRVGRTDLQTRVLVAGTLYYKRFPVCFLSPWHLTLSDRPARFFCALRYCFHAEPSSDYAAIAQFQVDRPRRAGLSPFLFDFVWHGLRAAFRVRQRFARDSRTRDLPPKRSHRNLRR